MLIGIFRTNLPPCPLAFGATSKAPHPRGSPLPNQYRTESPGRRPEFPTAESCERDRPGEPDRPGDLGVRHRCREEPERPFTTHTQDERSHARPALSEAPQQGPGREPLHRGYRIRSVDKESFRENIEVLVRQVAGWAPLESSVRGAGGRRVGVKLSIDVN